MVEIEVEITLHQQARYMLYIMLTCIYYATYSLDVTALQAKEQAHFAQFIPTHEPFQIYIERKRKDGVHGNNPEIQAISELYNRPVQVYIPSHGATPINIFQSEYKTSDIPIRLAYHDGNHYNAIVDPFLPTAGLGLGLPGLEPGLADKLQMQRAKQESDRIFINQIARQTHDMELKRAMEESSKLASMDYWMMLPKKRALEYSAGAGGVGGAGVGGGDDDLTDATTNFELQEQIALLSSLESYHGHGHGHGHGQSNLLPTGTTSITKSHIGTSTTRKERFEDDVIFPGKGHDKEKEDEIQQGEKNGTVSHHGSISMIDMSVMDMKGHGPTLSHLHDHEHDHPVDSYGATLHHDHEHHHHHPHHHHHHHHPLTMMHHHSKAGGRGGLSNQFLSICIGIVHGISGPGGVLGVIPAVQLHNLTLSVVYLGSFCITSILVMGCFAAMYGMCSSRISESSRVVEIRMEIFSSSLSILVGSMWLILISMGKLHDVFP